MEKEKWTYTQKSLITVEKDEFSQQKSELESVKLKLEQEKLTQEIKHLKRPLLLNPQYLSPIAAIILTCIGIWYTSYTGLWDVKRATLDNQKLVLQIDIDKFEKEKDSIKLAIARSKIASDSLNRVISSLKIKVANASKDLRDLSAKYKAEKKGIVKDLDDINNLINANKTQEAFNKLSALVTRLNGLTKRNFSNDFSDDFK